MKAGMRVQTYSLTSSCKNICHELFELAHLAEVDNDGTTVLEVIDFLVDPFNESQKLIVFFPHKALNHYILIMK